MHAGIALQVTILVVGTALSFIVGTHLEEIVWAIPLVSHASLAGSSVVIFFKHRKHPPPNTMISDGAATSKNSKYAASGRIGSDTSVPSYKVLGNISRTTRRLASCTVLYISIAISSSILSILAFRGSIKCQFSVQCFLCALTVIERVCWMVCWTPSGRGDGESGLRAKGDSGIPLTKPKRAYVRDSYSSSTPIIDHPCALRTSNHKARN
jgi:hypothetical protein